MRDPPATNGARVRVFDGPKRRGGAPTADAASETGRIFQGLGQASLHGVRWLRAVVLLCQLEEVGCGGGRDDGRRDSSDTPRARGAPLQSSRARPLGMLSGGAGREGLPPPKSLPTASVALAHCARARRMPRIVHMSISASRGIRVQIVPSLQLRTLREARRKAKPWPCPRSRAQCGNAAYVLRPRESDSFPLSPVLTQPAPEGNS